MANSQNLKPIKKGELSSEEAKKRGSIGGKKSVEKRREKKELKEIFSTFLAMNATDNMKAKVLDVFPQLENENLSMKATLVGVMIKKILEGDVKAFELMRDTIGEKPIDKAEIKQKMPTQIFVNKADIQNALERTRNLAEDE